MSRRVPRFVLLSSMALLLLSLASCSDDGGDNNGGGDLSPEVANDVAVAFAGMLATDNGGWMTEVKTSFDATPRLAPGLAAARFGGGPVMLAGDTTFTPAGSDMDWSLNYTYYDGLGTPSEVYVPGVTTRAIVRCEATGSVTLSGGGTAQNYVHRDTMHVDNMADTLVTYGSITDLDSAFVTVGGRYYFFDNLVEYTAEMSQYPVQAWPVAGDVVIDGFVDRLRSPSRTDRSAQYDVVMTITFDGTQTPLATVHRNVETPVSHYQYRVNLKTGAVTAVSAGPGVASMRGRIAAAR